MGLIFWPEDVQGLTQFGVKGEELHSLSEAGAVVPDWFLIPPEAFYSSLTEEEYDELLAASESERVVELNLSYKLSFDLNKQLEESIYKLCPNDDRVAIRPSDTDQAALKLKQYGGAYESFLFIEVENIARAVRAVWKTAFSNSLQTSRLELGLSPLPKAPSVIVQKMLAADSSGVAFSANPQSGKRDEAVIHAVPGLSTAMVVQGSVYDTYLIDKAGHITDRQIVEKRMKHVCDHETMHGVVQVEVPDSEASNPAVADQDAIKLAALARKVAANRGQPQALAWAKENGQIYALGLQQIDELIGLPDPDAKEYLWQAGTMSAAPAGIVTPLAAALYRRLWGDSLAGALKLLGFNRQSSETAAAGIKNALGCIHGRLYTNQTLLAERVAALPGCNSLKQDLAAIFQIPEPLLEQSLESLPQRVKQANLIAAVGMSGKLTGALKNVKQNLKKYAAKVEKLEQQLVADIGLVSVEEVFSRLDSFKDDIDALLSMRQLALLQARWLSWKLTQLTHEHCEDQRGMIARSLLISEQEIPGTALISACGNLASEVSASQTMVDILRSGDDEKALRALCRNANLTESYNAALAELEAETCWLDHGGPLTEKDYLILLLESLRCGGTVTAGLSLEGGESPVMRVKRLAQEKLDKNYPDAANAIKEVRKVISLYQQCYSNYMNLNHGYVKVLNAVGKLYLRAGELIREGNALQSADDIVWLSTDEIDDFLAGRLYESNLQQIIEQRQGLYEQRFFAEFPPIQFKTHGPVHLGNQILQPKTELLNNERNKVSGIGCGAGLLRARVKVAYNFENLNLRSGDILVLPSSDNRFRITLHAVGGLIIEDGASTDELVMLALSLSKPVVLGPAGVCQWLENGLSVEINAGEGLIRKTE